MKKLIALILTLMSVISLLSACGGDTAPDASGSSGASSTTDTASNASSESEEPLDGGLDIPYSSIAQGYISHKDIHVSSIVKHSRFESMDEEYLFLPAGTIIMSNSEVAIYCYSTYLNSEGFLQLDKEACEDLGQSFSPEFDLSRAAGTWTLEKDTIVRFTVMGSLSDVQIFVSLGDEDKVKLGSATDFATN